MREQLTADRTYYVSTTGNNSNNGLTSGSAFLTIAKATDIILKTLDGAGYTARIQLADGTYNESVTITSDAVNFGQIHILGNLATPGNVIINDAAANNAVHVAYAKTPIDIKGVRLQSTGSSGIYAHGGAWITFGKIEFGTCGGAHLYANGGSTIQSYDNYTILGNATYHAIAQFQSMLFFASGKTTTMSGTRAFTEFLNLYHMSYANFYSQVITGTATGKRYTLGMLSGVLTRNGDGNVNYFPGNVAGSAGQGSQYV
jgi:hypothetical protein